MRYIALFSVLFIGLAARAEDATTISLDSLDLAHMSQDFGSPRKNESVDKHPLTIGGKEFKSGVGTHAVSRLMLDLDGSAGTFHAMVGVDDEVHAKGSVQFKVIGDHKTLFDSGVMKGGQAAKACDVKLDGVKRLSLVVEDGGNGIDSDHADWADASFSMSSGTAKIVVHEPPVTPPYILTPAAPPTPRINGAKVFGVRPGNPFMYTIAATGDRPMTFSADGLPDGLTLDKATGLITGKLTAPGEFKATLHANNAAGDASGPLKIVCGPTIALTPAMGWNSWNCWATSVSDAKVRAAADAFVSKGLINHGWTYVNIDDVWENQPGSDNPDLQGPPRDEKGFINSNKKFPDMKALTDYVHSKGLKCGLYSSPGPTTCDGCTASYQHEDQDAQRWADWGFDYIKYDWCSYGGIAKHPDLAAMKKPYQVLRASLDKQPRDILFSFCQYGMGDVWKWGAETGGNSWRTTGDINDSWGSLSSIAFSQDGHEKYAGPGHWNDPDMLVVGHVGWGPALHPSNLTPDEQYLHISMWCLLSSPLLIGCDLDALDDFTLNLLTNDEVLAVNQDPLGKPAGRIVKQDYAQIWARDLEDGSKAVGLVNLDEDPQEITLKWSDLKIRGPQTVRDLWRQKDMGQFADEFKATVPPHGVVLIKVRT